VAQRFLTKGARVTVTTWLPEGLAWLGVETIGACDLSARVRPGMLVLHSIPPDGPLGLLDPLRDKARRLVYLSSTAVYGAATIVNELTPIDPDMERAWSAPRCRARGRRGTMVLADSEASGDLRPGTWRSRIDPAWRAQPERQIVSRIHVEDLASHAEAALLSAVSGAYPLADDEPCSSREIAEFCARLLDLPLQTRQSDLPVNRASRGIVAWMVP
jgi:nucleoside-diphosphate-sugar epimerase